MNNKVVPLTNETTFDVEFVPVKDSTITCTLKPTLNASAHSYVNNSTTKGCLKLDDVNVTFTSLADLKLEAEKDKKVDFTFNFY